MTDPQMLENSFCQFCLYRRTKDLVPLFDPKVQFLEIVQKGSGPTAMFKLCHYTFGLNFKFDIIAH